MIYEISLRFPSIILRNLYYNLIRNTIYKFWEIIEIKKKRFSKNFLPNIKQRRSWLSDVGTANI